MPGLLGKKIGMTSVFSADGKNIPCTVIEVGPWIVSKRQKTGVPFQIKLMDIPIQIIERYKSFRKDCHYLLAELV